MKGLTIVIRASSGARWIAVLAAALAAGALAWTQALGAQAAAEWSSPTILTRQDALLQQATLAADPWGGVYVFWTQNAEADVDRGGPQNIIFASYWDGTYWSFPIDIIVGPTEIGFSSPFAAISPAGRVFLLWAGSDGLYLSSAPADTVLDPTAWQPATRIAFATGVASARMVLDSRGTIHLVLTEPVAGTNVLYLRSDDNGESWTNPAPLSALGSRSAHVPAKARIRLDSQDRLHVVWTENHPPEYFGRQVFYTTSKDGGESWVAPVPLSELATATGIWNDAVDLAVGRDDSLHVVWTCGRVGRCYRYASGPDQEWSAPIGLFDGLVGLSGWDALAADARGNVYWMGALREPQGVYFSSLSADAGWTDPPILVESAASNSSLGNAHFVQLVATQGNLLHALMIGSDKGPIWYLRGFTDQPSLQSAPMPAAAPTDPPNVEPTSVPELSPTLTPFPFGSFDAPQESGSTMAPLLVAFAAVAGLIGVVVLVRRSTGRR